MKKLILIKHISQDELVVEFNGVIDEHSDFKELSNTEQKSIIFDLKNVTMLNSCGIKHWLAFLDKMPVEVTIRYENCPPILIEQMNMVRGFIRKKAWVKSFYAPYYCEKCDEESKIILTMDHVKDCKVSKMTCPHCGHEDMSIDAVENQYLSLMKKYESA